MLWLMLMRHHILAFLFIRVGIFLDENGLLAKPLGLRCLRHRLRGLARWLILLHHRQMITDGLPHGLAVKLFFSELVELLFQLLRGEFPLFALRSCCHRRV